MSQRTKWWGVAGILAALALLGLGLAVVTRPPPHRETLANIRIGMTNREVWKVMGTEPQGTAERVSGNDGRMFTAEEQWTVEGGDVVVEYDANGRVTARRFVYPRARTAWAWLVSLVRWE